MYIFILKKQIIKFSMLEKAKGIGPILKEIETIERYGLNNLCNMTDGGEGISGFSFNEVSKQKMAIAKIGKPGNRLGHRNTIEQNLRHSEFMKDKKYSADNRIYKFISKDGEEFVGKRYQFCKKFNFSIGAVWHIVNKKKCLNGWALKGYDFSINKKSMAKQGKNNAMFGKCNELSHRTNNSKIKAIKDSEIFIGTFYEFAEKYKINKKFASEFFKGRKKSCYGWRIAPPSKD